MAGLDGVINQIEPPPPMDVDLYELEGEAKKRIKQTPGSLEEVLDALDADRDFLMRGDVFTEDLIEAWLTLKRQSAKEVARSEEHTSELQSRGHLVCRLLL